MNQISVDACGEQCAELDDFNWFLPTDEWYGKSDGPESEMDTSYSGNGVHITTSDSSSPEMDTMSQWLSRPKGGCQTAMPRRKRRRRSVRTTDSTSVMDTRQESVAPSTLDSDMIHKNQNVSHRGSLSGKQLLRLAMECSDCSRTDPLPSGSGRLSPAGHDTPAEMNICNTPDNLQIEMSGMLLKMADGSPPAEVTILTDPDILQKELFVMTVMLKRWMERFVMNPQVLCLDGLTSNYDPEDRCSKRRW